MALSGVRSSWLMVARKRLLAVLARSASSTRVLERLLLRLALGDVAHHGDHLALARPQRFAERAVERPAAHLDPDEAARAVLSRLGALAPHAEFDRLALASRPRRRAPSDRPAGPPHARGRTGRGRRSSATGAPNSRSAAGEAKSTDAVAAVPRDHVGHVAREQPVAVLLGIEQPEAGARERLGAEREPGRVERGRDDAERGERAVPLLGGRRRRQQIVARCRTSAGRRRRAPASRRSRPRGARRTAPPRAGRSPARSPRTTRCRRSSPPPW